MQDVMRTTVRVEPFLAPVTIDERPDVAWDLTVPEDPALTPAVGRAVIDSLERGETGYTSGAGIEQLCQAVAGWSTSGGFPVNAGQVVITNGGSEARYIVLRELVTPGRRVLLTDQFGSDTERLATMVCGDVVVSTELPAPEAGDLVMIAQASGVDGSLLDPARLTGFLRVAADAGATVVLDRSDLFDSYLTPETFSQPELTGDVITIGSFSGMFGLDGWRIGYLTAPETLVRGLAVLKESMSISTSTPSQFAALTTLEQAASILDDARSKARAKRDLATGILDATGLAYRMPAVYPGLLVDAGMDDQQAAVLLAVGGVRVDAGSHFSDRLAGWLRIDLRAPAAVLEGGIRQMATVLNEARK